MAISRRLLGLNFLALVCPPIRPSSAAISLCSGVSFSFGNFIIQQLYIIPSKVKLLVDTVGGMVGLFGH